MSTTNDITPEQMAREIQVIMPDEDGESWTSTVGSFIADNTDAGELLLTNDDAAALRMLACGLTTEVYIGGGDAHSAMFVLRAVGQ